MSILQKILVRSCAYIMLTLNFFSCQKLNYLDPNPNQITIGVIGASLIEPANGWVEMACKKLSIGCINRAIGGDLTFNAAQRFYKNEYFTQKELQNIDILLIQFANCKDVCGNQDSLLPTTQDYTNSYTEFSDQLFREYNYAQQMDYIIKKWQEICRENNTPMHIIFVTHWHDSRATYNESVRKLAARWNADVLELDKNIGFSKEEPLPDGTQPSIRYAMDTETINGIVYGYHPLRNKEGEYIQNRMASILLKKLKSYIPEHNIK